MKQKHRTRPYQQGDFDSLCAVYAIVNAMRYLHVVTDDDEAQELFQEILEFLQSKSSLLERMWAGTNFRDLSGILTHVITTQYPVMQTTPFRRQRGVTMQHYWHSCGAFLAQTTGIVLTGLPDHWTLIQSMTDQSLTLLDSDHRARLLRRHCVISGQGTRHNSKQHILYPNRTCFLWVD